MFPVYQNKYDLGLMENWLDFLNGWKKSTPLLTSHNADKSFNV